MTENRYKASGSQQLMTSSDRQLEMAGRRGEEGYILVVTMFILVVLSLIGLSATNLSQVELLISGNDRIHKETFYRADAGTEVGARLVYDNAVCIQVNGGFDATTGTVRQWSRTASNDTFLVSDLTFANPKTLASTTVSDANRSVAYYEGAAANDALPHTNLLANGEMKYSPGSGLQMISGYEGLGASSIGGGTHFEYDIYSQHQGVSNSESVITVGWKLSSHIINNAASDDCNSVYTN